MGNLKRSSKSVRQYCPYCLFDFFKTVEKKYFPTASKVDLTLCNELDGGKANSMFTYPCPSCKHLVTTNVWNVVATGDWDYCCWEYEDETKEE